MSDIICTRDGYECNGCPIKEKCDDADNHTSINLWEIYQQGRADAIDDVLKLKKCNHYDMWNELMNQSIKVSDIERLKEKKNEK